MNEELLIAGRPGAERRVDRATNAASHRRGGDPITASEASLRAHRAQAEAAVAVAASLVGLLVPWATPAFAGWSAQPTTPPSGQLSTAEAACASLATNLANVPGSTAPSTLPPVSLSDVRGPYSLLVYGTTNPDLCVLGNGISSLHEAGQAAIGMSSTVANGNTAERQHGRAPVLEYREHRHEPFVDASPAPDAAVVDISNTTVDNGQSFWVVEGRVGSQVTGATVLLTMARASWPR